MALKINRGKAYNLGYYHKTNGVVAPLVGCTLYFTVKSTEYDSDLADSTAYIIKTLTSFTDAVNGYTVISLSDAETAYKTGTTTFIDPTLEYRYDVSVKEADGKTYKRDEGTVKFDASPTNRNLS